jgi:CRISPR-associated protein Csb2
MTAYFRITVHFLAPLSHGRGDAGEPEWPPSPLRVFQALVAASAARWNERRRVEFAAPALHWLERQPMPSISAPVGKRASAKYRLYVPDNIGDKVAGSWSRGGTASIADYRTEKDVRATNLTGNNHAVHYLWRVNDGDPELDQHKDVLVAAAQSITHLGWGIDMVAANASVITDAEADALSGERWRPCDDQSATGLRVPVEGTLDALVAKHSAFLNRLTPDGFIPVPPLSAFQVGRYQRATDPPQCFLAAFSLLRPDRTGFRPFDPARRTTTVAAMMRYAAGDEHITHALGWPEEKIASFIRGHGEPPGQSHLPVQGPRLAYIPLPSLEYRGGSDGSVVGSIRRALIAVFGGQANQDLQQVARLLSGTPLIDEHTGSPVAILSKVPNTDEMVGRYTSESPTWATVTPLILPGHDDRGKLRRRLFPVPGGEGSAVDSREQKALLGKLDHRIDHLIRKAIRQGGFSDELAQYAEIDWRKSGFWPGTQLATEYQFPNNLRRFRRLHVRISWRDRFGNEIKVPGPICLGGGRFNGLGLFANCGSGLF